ncbi:hypothetical protein [Streptosporangium amethystogenes]|uniref:hypothetical protein n=1 Tax=Streptosporangium amethystogenes TaxID=2002 RepID=UPI0004C93BF7|nr:hypothetical protein [Streptosporangium amethystogenes]
MLGTLKISTAVVVASAALALAPAGAANAAPATTAGTGPASASAGTAPSCVKRQLVIRQGVRLTNKCGRTMRVKVLVKRGKDSWCFTMKNNQRRFWAFVPQAAFAKYERTVTC